MLLGKIYKKKGINDKAHFYFNTALDLESKDAQKIKGFIESLHNTGGDDEMDIWIWFEYFCECNKLTKIHLNIISGLDIQYISTKIILMSINRSE